ncbi:jg24595 [Pararge aegeria aegeria]|uniref:Jg24595 protein n=1 Tax=Pararge aegeria aegeria TaxID=348720 RepID=A0A8S4QZG4_9NEOP|nr:jg24595 [Pararge aegeria aegeria]
MSIPLAMLTPLPEKVRETANNELNKKNLNITCLPGDLKVERPTPPSQLMHPAEREKITYTNMEEINSQDNNTTNEENNINYIYTDGSKHNNGVGAAYVKIASNGNQSIKKFKLHDSCSVYQAELFATLKALENIDREERNMTYHICSDSRSGLEEIGIQIAHIQ